MTGNLFRTRGDNRKLYDKVISDIEYTQKQYSYSLKNPSRFMISTRAGALPANAADAEKATAVYSSTCSIRLTTYVDSNSDANLELSPNYQKLDEEKTAKYQ